MEPMFTMCPLVFLSKGIRDLVTCNKPFILVSIILFQWSKSPSSRFPRPAASPALFTNTSIACHSAGIWFTKDCTCSACLTSTCMVYVLTPYFVSITLACSVSLSALRPLSIRSKPSFAKVCAAASPIPDVVPVINAILLIFWPCL